MDGAGGGGVSGAVLLLRHCFPCFYQFRIQASIKNGLKRRCSDHSGLKLGILSLDSFSNRVGVLFVSETFSNVVF